MTNISNKKAGTISGNQVFKKKRYIGLAYISLWIIGFLVFQLYPLAASLFYSLTEYNMLKAPIFVGLKNYINMFTNDEYFWQSVKVTFQYVIVGVPAKLIFALFIAMILNVKVKGVNLFRTIFYIPSILGGSVAVSVLWIFLFMRDGIINQILSFFRIGPVDWLGNPNISLYVISLMLVWQFGSSMVLFLAGLKQIPASLYEAAKVDGATKKRMFFSITLPLLSPIVFFNLIMQLIITFQDFTSAYVVTRGGPLHSTYLYGFMMYENGFKHFKMGYASAQSWVLFLIIITFTALLFRSSKYWIHYQDGGEF